MVAVLALDRIRRRDARFPPAGYRAGLAAAGNGQACVHVRDRVQPVLHVARVGPTSSFSCGGAHASRTEWVEVPSAELAAMDPTLASIRDLRGGFEAVRPGVGGPWTRRRIPRA